MYLYKLLGNRWGDWREKPHSLEVKIFSLLFEGETSE